MHGGGGMGMGRMLRSGELDKDLKLSKGLIKRVAQFARPYRWGLLMLLVTLGIASFLSVYVPGRLAIRIFDDALLVKNRSLLATLVIVFIAVAVSTAIVQVIARWLSSRIGEGLIFDLRVGLYDHVQKMPLAFFTRTQTGALISRLSTDVVGAQRAITETTAGVVSIIMDLGFALGGMWGVSPKLTFISMALVPLFLLPTRKMGKLLQRLIRQQMENNAQMSSQMTERFQIGGALLVKLFGTPHTEVAEFSDKAGKVRDLGIRTAIYGRVFFVMFGLVASVGTGLVYWFGGNDVISGDMTVGKLVAFTMFLTRMYMPITMLSNIRIEVMTAMVSFDRVFELLDFPIAIADKPNAVDLENPRGLIEFRDVKFRYPTPSEVTLESLELKGSEARERANDLVLQDVSFTIQAGQMFALVGPSGAGKTTITSLVPRLYEASEGAVLVDGKDVRDLTLDSLRDAIGVVTQDAHMFHETIRHNLQYARPGATEQDIEDALKAAQIWDLIDSLPDRLDTPVGERGYRLSGGEKQRLAIARLLLKNPAIMILDEATAHLDSESERLIQRALAQALSGRSSLVIAHRLSTIVNADQILVIDDGRVVERGTHFELLEKGGLYGELYRTQFQRHERADGEVEDDEFVQANGAEAVARPGGFFSKEPQAPVEE